MDKNKEEEYREKWLNLGLPVEDKHTKKKRTVLMSYTFLGTLLLIFIILYNWIL